MKRILQYIIGLLVICNMACTKEEWSDTNCSSDANKITLKMGINVPEFNSTESRTFKNALDASEFPPLWLVVFDEAGYLTEYTKAKNFSRQDGVTTFEVTLTPSSETRIIHFLLNYANDLTLEPGLESEIIGCMHVSNEQGVYWQRVKLDQGISKNESSNTIKGLDNVQLIRNFAKLNVRNSASNFTLTGYCLWHQADKGTVAPFNNGKFVDYLKDNNLQKSYEEFMKEDYHGFIPDDAAYHNVQPNAQDWMHPDVSSYLYEHKASANTPGTGFSVLIKGKWGSDTQETYYKADLIPPPSNTNKIPESYHILRNFEYCFNIQKVVASGKSTVAEAISDVANNNLSGSIQILTLRNISDGESALYVSYVDTVLVTTAPIELHFKYIPDLRKKNVTANDQVHFQWKSGDIFDTATDLRTTFKDNPTTGWAKITLTPRNINMNELMHTVLHSLNIYCEKTKVATSEKQYLNREIRFKLRPSLEMMVNCHPKEVQDAYGAFVTVNTLIPNHLNRILFPMAFLYESQDAGNTTYLDQLISPYRDESMDVRLGPTIVEGFTNQNSYHYEKWLEYEDYLALKQSPDGSKRILSCKFVTNTNESASDIYVDNKYFTKQKVSFQNYHLINPLDYLENDYSAQRYGVGQEVKMKLTVTESETFTFMCDEVEFIKIEETGAEIHNNTIHLEPGTYTVISKTKNWGDKLHFSCMTTRNSVPFKPENTPSRNYAHLKINFYTINNNDIWIGVLNETTGGKDWYAEYSKDSYKSIDVKLSPNLNPSTKVYFAYIGNNAWRYSKEYILEDLVKGSLEGRVDISF